MGMAFSKICVVGLGYIGLPTAAMFASRKVEVIGLDVNQTVVDKINQGEIHIVEPDLDIVVRSVVSEGYLKASMIAEPAQAFLIAVPTPFKGDNHQPDLSYIESAARMIAPVLKPGNLVVLESTSPVGATEKMANILSSARTDLTFPMEEGGQSDIRIAHCPERVLPGHVMRELVENDRVIGGMSEKCSQCAVELYKTFVVGDCVVTNTRTAEMAKLTENSFRDVNIAFANELSIICDELDIDVWELIGLANRHPRVNILKPGPGVGGHCIAVDPWFIISKTPELAKLVRTARDVNDYKPDWVIEKAEARIGKFLIDNPTKTAKDVTIACYGLAFKADIDDLRESPALEITKKLAKQHAGKVIAVEPNITALPKDLKGVELASVENAQKEADVHVVLVGHKEILSFEAESSWIVVDVVGASE